MESANTANPWNRALGFLRSLDIVQHADMGVAELERTVTPGGTAFIIDSDLRSGTFAAWLHSAYPDNPFASERIETFWHTRRFTIAEL